MLYLLVTKWSGNLFILSLFDDIVFRSVAALFTALLFGMVMGPSFIRFMVRTMSHRTHQRYFLTELHQRKKGTPSIGGILIIASILFSVFLWADIKNTSILIACFVLISFAGIGLWDDLLKTTSKGEGINGYVKLLMQILLALLVGIFLWFNSEIPDLYSALNIPFIKSFKLEIGIIIFLILQSIVISGTSNAVNLTDGLDGLATGSAIMAFTSFMIISYLVGNQAYAEHFHLEYIKEVKELPLFCASVIGACVAFLWFNAHPAQIFMGDTGSLSLGAALGFVAVASKHELALIFIGGIFVVETVSVIIQSSSFKLTGKKVFAMAPLHHHFEKLGYQESKIIMRFWIVAIICSLIGLSSVIIKW